MSPTRSIAAIAEAKSCSRRGDVVSVPGDVAEVAEGDQVLGVESERGMEELTRLIEASGFEERLRQHDVTADVRGLLREMGPTECDRLVQITGLAVLVRQWGEVASRVLVEFLFELVKPGGAGHSMPSGAPRGPGGETGQSIFF